MDNKKSKTTPKSNFEKIFLIGKMKFYWYCELVFN